MKKELLHYDEGSAVRDINMLNDQVIPAISNKVVSAFEALEIGQMDKQDYEDLFFANGEKIEARILNTLETQLDKVGIRGSRLKNSLRNESLTAFETLMQQVGNVKAAYGNYGVFKFVDFKKGKPVFTESSRNQIDEKYKLFVESEEGLKLKALHQAAVNITNEYLAALQTSIQLGGFAPLARVFNVKDENGVKVSAALTDYDSICKMARRPSVV